jgi:ribosome-associated translation inhibitor RaiA
VKFEILVDLDPMDAFRSYLERRIRFALGRFSRSIRRVTVRVATTTAPDFEARGAITISLIPTGRIALVERAGDLHAAIDRAVEAVRRKMAWRLERQRAAAAMSR